MFINKIPDDLELLALFESEPVYQNLEDLQYSYEYKNENDFSLLFTFHITVGWIKVTIKYKDQEIAKYLTEGVSSFEIIDKQNEGFLSLEVLSKETITNIKIQLRPSINLNVSTLER